MANILVTGSDGQLGLAIRKRGFSCIDEVFYTNKSTLDISNIEVIKKFIVDNDIDTIINCAAYTKVDLAEDESEVAYKTNVEAVSNLAKISFQEGCLLVHISTDYVFDGKSQIPYKEGDTKKPLSVYAKTKSEAEDIIRQSDCLHIIIRTSWLYGESANNFVKAIKKKAENGEAIKVVDDQIGSPTYAGDLADAIVQILDDPDLLNKEGIYHFSNGGECSWFQFAEEILRLIGSNNQILPIKTSEYSFKALRPEYSVLNTNKIVKNFKISINDWKISLANHIMDI